MKELILGLLCAFCCQTVFCQSAVNHENPPPNSADFSSDRPGAGSDAVGVLGIGFLQIESGTQYSNDRGEINSMAFVVNDFQILNTLLRLGVLPNMELRLGVAYQHVQSTYEGIGLPITGFVPLFIGTKIRICEEKGLRPKMSASMGVSLPSTGKREFQVQYVIPTITFLTETTITEHLSLTGNFGAEWDVEKLQSIGTYALSADAALTSRLGAFMEFYGSIPEKDKTEHLFDAGFIYLVKYNLQVDLSSGISFTESAPDYFVGLGLSWMLISNI